MRMRKRKTIWAYLDGKKLVDVVQAALDYIRSHGALSILKHCISPLTQ